MNATNNRPHTKIAGLALALTLTMLAQTLRADLLELTNGDHYRGKVVSMDSQNIEFVSEIQGRVHIPRVKVAQITFVEAAPQAAPQAARTNANPVAAIPAPRSAAKSAAPDTAEAVVEQMRQNGVSPQLMNQVQEQIFGKASPEATQKFNDIMNGLMSGSISVQDLRGQAVNAIRQAREAKQELGGDAGDMLDGYINILEKFVAEADSTPAAKPAAPLAKPSASTASAGSGQGTGK